MGSINMSPALGVNQINMLFGRGTGGLGYHAANRAVLASNALLCRHGQSTGECSGRILIMKGTKPTAPIASMAAYLSDVLITFDSTYWTSGSGSDDFGLSQGGNPYTLATIFKAAAQAGTATWFILLTSELSAGNTYATATQPLQQIIGTVGTTGSGADMTLSDVNIVSGTQYRIYNFRLAIPTSWTY